MFDLLDFNEFQNSLLVLEAAKSGSTVPVKLLVAAEDVEKAQLVITDIVSRDPKPAIDAWNEISKAGSKGSVFSMWEENLLKREKSKVDEGPLTKLGPFYIGKDAWKVNSAKLLKLGLAPEGFRYFDSEAEALYEKHFGGEEIQDTEETETRAEDGETGVIDINRGQEEDPTSDSDYAEEPYAIAAGVEPLKYLKSKAIFEQEEFSVGVIGSEKTKRNAVIFDVEEIVPNLVDAFLEPHLSNLFIWGAPGIGKTDVVHQAAASIEEEVGQPVRVMTVTMAHKAMHDIGGLPLLIADVANMSEDDRSSFEEDRKKLIADKRSLPHIGVDFAYPAWLPPMDSKELGIIFLDELNRAPKDVLGASLTLLMSRSAGEYRIPNGWRIWGAGNRVAEAPNITEIDLPVAARLGKHLHMIPTVSSWIKWARSEKAYYTSYVIPNDPKDSGKTTSSEFFIPDELISFLEMKDVDSPNIKQPDTDTGNTGDRQIDTTSGKKYRVKFDYFYEHDQEAADEAGGTGIQVGQPSPRSWAQGSQTMYSLVNRTKALFKEVDPKLDPKYRVISAFGIALANDDELTKRIQTGYATVVGAEAAQAFISFAKQLARMNDSEGTFVQKLANVFDDPSGARPLMNVDRPSGEEKFGVLKAVEGRFNMRVDANGSMDIDTLLNWMDYLMALEDNNKAERQELNPHVFGLIARNKHEVKDTIIKAKAAGNTNRKALQNKFMDRFVEAMQQLEDLKD